MPPDADPGVFILSDGKHTSKTIVPRVRALAQLFQAYRDGLPTGAKEQSTLTAEDRHMKHLKRLLRANTEVQYITLNRMQEYVRQRSQEKWRGKHIDPQTIKKELATFRYVWNWGVLQGFLTGPAPVKGILLPKSEEKLPFMSWDEITAVIDQNSIPESNQKQFWDRLFLRSSEVEQLLDYIQATARFPFVYPLFTFVAHTGCRRSELARSEVADLDFKSRTVLLREKKKSHQMSLTFRRVQMTDRLHSALSEWIALHPGGRPTFPGKNPDGLTSDQLTNYFYGAVEGSQWEVVRGYHVFRHSFASNYAASGTDQRFIDDWLGHQTDEMRRRYRHLFPNQQQTAIQSIFQRDGT